MLQAKRQRLRVTLIPQHEVDLHKVEMLVAHLLAGGEVPPVVLALYGSRALPLDGHHRVLAHERLGLEVDAWVVSGRAFDSLCTKFRDAEAHVMCGGLPAREVASAWEVSRGAEKRPLD